MDENTGKKHLLIDRIIDKATSEFFSKGVKAVRMDDIAKGVGISKRTLYEIFEDKEQLLLECAKRMAEKDKKEVDDYVAHGHDNVIDIVIEFYLIQIRKLNEICPQFLMEVRKYSSINKWMEEHRKKEDKEAMEFFKRGIDEGYFRKDVNYQLIQIVCGGSMEYIIKHSTFKNFSIKQVFKDVTMLYIRGFCTLKGIEALEKSLSAIQRTEQTL